MTDFDAVAFLKDKFPDSQTLRETVRYHGFEPPSLEQIRNWRRRDNIPTPWLVCLLAVLEKHWGIPTTITPYLRRIECHESPTSRIKSSSSGISATIFD
jgi:hypothetical protein